MKQLFESLGNRVGAEASWHRAIGHRVQTEGRTSA